MPSIRSGSVWVDDGGGNPTRDFVSVGGTSPPTLTAQTDTLIYAIGSGAEIARVVVNVANGPDGQNVCTFDVLATVWP